MVIPTEVLGAPPELVIAPANPLVGSPKFVESLLTVIYPGVILKDFKFPLTEIRIELFAFPNDMDLARPVTEVQVVVEVLVAESGVIELKST